MISAPQRSFLDGGLIDDGLIQCGVTVGEHVAEGNDQCAIVYAVEHVWSVLAQLGERVACDLKLAFDSRLAVVVCKIRRQ